MNSDSYPWKYALNLGFDISIFLAAIVTIIKPAFAGLGALSAGDFALIGTIVITLCMVIEHRDRVVYQSPYYQSILSESLQAPYLNMMAVIRNKASKSAFYLMLLGTLVAGFGGIKL